MQLPGLEVFDEVEKGTVASVRVKEQSHRCPMCMRRERERARNFHQEINMNNVPWMIKDPVGDAFNPPRTVAYISDCPVCGYTCVYQSDLVQIKKEEEKNAEASN